MKKYIIGLLLISVITSCTKMLEEEVFIEVSSYNFYQNDDDAILAVNALYAKMRSDGPVTANSGKRESWGFYAMGEGSIFNFNEVTTDEIYVAWESYGGFFQYFEEFTWLPNSGGHFDEIFSDLYEGIGIANDILAHIENSKISKEVSERVKGEALMARGMFYSTALSFYGHIPLVIDVVSDPLFLPQQVKPEDIAATIVSDLTNAASLLPTEVAASEYGRFTKGAALATLARFQLNRKNWEAARDAARDVIELGLYSTEKPYTDIFAVENQGNPEIIISIPCLAQPGIGNTFVAHTAEPNYVSNGWGGHLIRNDFYATFDPDDQRRNFLINSYTTTTGGSGSTTKGYMIMKYEVDSNKVGAWAGNDLVLHRYSEVLLTLAEALNEISGPNQESIDLINQLRSRAFNNNASKLLNLADFTTKEQLRDHILNERGWELYAEGYRRDDLIRHGKFISKAIERGKAAKDFHVLFPIPQTEMDKNTNLIQNDGYAE